MRTKVPKLVITFPTTTAALEWERRCQALSIPGRIIPVPVTMPADCGLAWALPPEARDRLLEVAELEHSACLELSL